MKFATYTRDAATGLDYADQRYYSSAPGRFLTPDPYQASAGPQDPASWNRYAFTRGDPANRKDPTGLDDDGCGAFDEQFCEGSVILSSGTNNDPFNLGIPAPAGMVNVPCDIFSSSSGVCTISDQAYQLLVGGSPAVLGTALSTPGACIGVGSGICVTAIPFVSGAGTATWDNWWQLILTIPKVNPVYIVVGIFLMQDGSSGAHKSPEQVRQNCTPVGPPSVTPSTRRGNRDGGQSSEQEYVCPDGSRWTIHTLSDKNGNILDEHTRPGGPKYGPGAPPRH